MEDTLTPSSPRKLPEGYLTVFLTLTLVMAAFALLQGLLVFYAGNQLEFSDKSAYLLYTAFTTMIFAVPILSGYIGGKFLGYPLAVTFGLTLAAIGLYLLCLNSVTYLYLGLATIIIGTSTTLACLFVLLGRLFQQKDYRRSAGFTLCYTGMNLGAFIALVASGYVVRHWNYKIAFLLSAILMLVALLVFILGIRTFLRAQIRDGIESNTPKKRPFIGIIALLAAIPIVTELLYFTKLIPALLLFLGIAAVGLILKMAINVDAEQRKKFITFLIVMGISILFWTLYMSTPSVVNLFITHNVNRNMFGLTIPTSDYIGLNPLCVVVLGFFLSALWLVLQKRKQIVSPLKKVTLGIIAIAVSYLVLALSTGFANSAGLVAVSWIVAAYAFQAIGELCVFPTGASMVGQFAPKKHEGVLMGVWLLSMGIGSLFSGYLAKTTTSPQHLVNPATTNPIYMRSFLQFGLIAIVLVILVILASRKLRPSLTDN